VLTCCGDRGDYHYKKARNPDNLLDKAAEHVLKHSGVKSHMLDFFPTGSDERQFCSPGFDLPVGSLMRSYYADYPEYHTSLDNLDFVSPDALLETCRVYVNLIYALEKNRRYKNLKPFGEPFLSKYGLYDTIGGLAGQRKYSRYLRYILNFSDGRHDLVDIAEKAGAPIWEFENVLKDLERAKLIEAIDQD